MRREGLQLKSLTLTARDKICFKPNDGTREPPPESVPKAEFVELREKFEALQAKYFKDVGKEQQRAARAEALSEEKDNTIKKLDKQLAEASKQTEKLIDVVKELVIRTGGGAAAAAKSSSAR